MSKNVLFGMGNPLLDILATVDTELLKKYDLKENDAILAADKHLPIYDEIVAKYQVEYIPGGATQNAIKVSQWVLGERYRCVYAGCVKDDRYGGILKESCEKIGVRTAYQYHKGPEGTGVCASMVTGHNRSMVTSLGAACCFTADHLDRPDIWSHVSGASLFYISSFFITSCHDALLKVAQHSLQTNKTFCLNLGAEFLVDIFNKQVIEAVEYADFVFGNETEALKLSEKCEFGTKDVEEIADRIGKIPFKKAGKRRTVVITQGADPIIIIDSKGARHKIPVNPLDPGRIVDTTGAGDAFVGGFLAQLLDGRSLEECVRCGKYAAEVIIQRLGCTLPDKCDYR